jgi:hypothetical protein
MTPKEKAKELVDKFQSGYTINGFNYQFQNDLEDAKQCALIAVDEIINTFIDIDPKLKYWQEVKQEIQKL